MNALTRRLIAVNRFVFTVIMMPTVSPQQHFYILTLKTIDANAMYYIPSRETEGYGMNKNAVDKLNERGIKLIITVDNGIAATQEVAYASFTRN